MTTAVDVAGTSRSRVYAVDGVQEPLVSAGKLVRDDDGQVVLIRRYSDRLLAELLRTRRPPPRERSVHFHLPVLTSVADAVGAMASIAEAVANAITPNEATELSRIVEAYIKAVETSEFDRRIEALEAEAK